MSEHDLPRQGNQNEEGEGEEGMHPLEAGIKAAQEGDTTSLEELFLG